MNSNSYIRGTFVDLVGALLVDVEDFHGYGIGLEELWQEGKGGDVGWRQHIEEIDGGEIEKLRGVDEEDTDTSCSLGSHC